MLRPISTPSALLLQNEQGHDKKVRPAAAYGRILLEAPINELTSKLVDRGFASDAKRPQEMSKWIYLKPEVRRRRYNAVIRGLMNYYSFVDNKNMMRRILWILRFSAVFTLCRKWRISAKALFRKLGPTLTIRYGRNKPVAYPAVPTTLTSIPLNFALIKQKTMELDPLSVVNYAVKVPYLRRSVSCV